MRLAEWQTVHHDVFEHDDTPDPGAGTDMKPRAASVVVSAVATPIGVTTVGAVRDARPGRPEASS